MIGLSGFPVSLGAETVARNVSLLQVVHFQSPDGSRLSRYPDIAGSCRQWAMQQRLAQGEAGLRLCVDPLGAQSCRTVDWLLIFWRRHLGIDLDVDISGQSAGNALDARQGGCVTRQHDPACIAGQKEPAAAWLGNPQVFANRCVRGPG
ncbi:hypothetical protein D3C72_1933110 [compost metagenome]